jgi:hypothetical protein
MKTERSSFPMLIAFNELALLSVFAIALMHSSSIGKAKKSIEQLGVDTAKAASALAAAKKSIGELETELKEKEALRYTEADLAKEIANAIANRGLKYTEADLLKEIAIAISKRRLKYTQEDLDKKLDEAKKTARISEVKPIGVEPIRNPLPPPVLQGAVISKELLDLKGDLNKIALVFDRSGSMRGERWEEARKLVRTWINRLDINECVLITFNDVAERFPADGKLLEMTDPTGVPNQKNRDALDRRIATIIPSGNTNTLAALEMAYSCPGVDTIILFTDGRPDLGNDPPAPKPKPVRRLSFLGMQPKETVEPPKELLDSRLVSEIYELCRRNTTLRVHKVPVNTVGLGCCFEDRQFVGFLQKIAALTGGTFIGR